MKTKILSLILVCGTILFAQNALKFIPLYADRPINTNFKANNAKNSIRILAVMVDFKEYTDAAVTGTGKFNTIYKKYKDSTNILDPQPFDKSYFSAHFEFANNYFKKITLNKVGVSTTILDNIVTVSKRIRDYSPKINSTDYTPLAQLAKEVWTRVKSENPSLDFSQYDIFMILHAGVGHDFQIPGTLGTERDLPSLYLSDKVLKNYLSDSVNQLPKNVDGQYNTIITPCTDSREVVQYGSTTLFNLSINGLIIANIGSHLGLPDLYNTKTGISRIGRFGLMDPQSFFAYSGTILPEPSAWEKLKIFEKLGIGKYPGLYELDITKKQDFKKINIKPSSIAGISDTIILKVPISATEYYLIENRSRDAKKDKCNITYLHNGQYKSVKFNYDQYTNKDKNIKGFASSDVGALKGVVVDVDEPDWAIPCRSYDDTAKVVAKGGLAIWHIDDKVISENLESNTVNTNKDLSGVVLEQAKGLQDIGEKYSTLFGDVYSEGDYTDLWFKGNDAKLYKNIFNENSRPSTNSNYGAKSLIQIDTISEYSNVMSLNLKVNNPNRKMYCYDLSSFFPNSKSFKNIWSNGNNYIFCDNQKFCSVKNGIVNTINLPTTYPSVTETGIFAGNLVSIDTLFNTKSLALNNSEITSPIVAQENTSNITVYAGQKDGVISKYVLNNNAVTESNQLKLGSSTITRITCDADRIFALSSDNSLINDKDTKIMLPEPISDLYLTKDANKNYISIAIGTSKAAYFVKDNSNTFIQVNFAETPTSKVVLGDVNNSGELSICYLAQGKLYVQNQSGAVLDNYPQVVNSVSKCLKVVTMDFNGDKAADIMWASDGQIYLVNGKTGKMVENFPISIGDVINDFSVNQRNQLTVKTDSGILVTYELSGFSPNGKLIHSEIYGNKSNTGYITNSNTLVISGNYFPKNKCYNWPNPVYGSTTNIRFYVNEDSYVKVRIVDLAGDKIEELNTNAKGGMDNEIPWDVKNIASGVYYANVEAKSITGKSQTNIVKVVVVK